MNARDPLRSLPVERATECEFCFSTATDGCRYCGALVCTDHMVSHKCPGCQPLSPEELDGMAEALEGAGVPA